MKKIILGLASTLLVATVGCGGDSMDPEVTSCTASTGSVTASVDVSGTAPVFSWEPDCALAALFVEGVTSGDAWLISTENLVGPDPQFNLISPPITYGTTSLPAGVETLIGAQSPQILVRWRSYLLILSRVVDPAITTCTVLFPIGPNMVCRLVVHQFTW